MLVEGEEEVGGRSVGRWLAADERGADAAIVFDSGGEEPGVPTVTVRKGTVFEDSPLELRLWLQASYLMCSSKKGVSANQLHRTLGITLKSAWFVGHRLRELREHDEQSERLTPGSQQDQRPDRGLARPRH